MKELTNCPFCNGDLVIKEAECCQCHTNIRGDFALNRFHQFDKEQLYFIEIFLKNEGNIKLMEKELGISYPTVKNKLQKIIKILGYKTEEQPVRKKEHKEDRVKVLKDLSDGKISATEAIKKLGEL